MDSAKLVVRVARLPAKTMLRFFRTARTALKRLVSYPFGLRAHGSCNLSWSAHVDGGGKGGIIRIGKSSSVGIGVVLYAYRGFIEIGDNCSINPYCVLYGAGGLRIGNGVRIAAQTVIVSSNHIFSDPDVFICEQGETAEGISIEDDVWIGAGARILDGVTIRVGTVIGAGSVVTKSTEPYSVIVGSPGRKVSSRRAD